ncbi:MAG: sulfotransferase, partial [Bacteroidota bacterium]
MKLAYIYIACHGHSGSTLLSKLFGTNPSMLNLGEIKHFDEYYLKNDSCGCGLLLQECPFWQAVANDLQQQDIVVRKKFPTDGYRSKSRLLNQLYQAILLFSPQFNKILSLIPNTIENKNQRATSNHWKLINTIARKAQRRILIDKSMSISRFLELLQTKPNHIDMYLLHLVRDGRANSYSYYRRYNTQLDKAANQWKEINQRIELIKKIRTIKKTTLVRYEDLVNDPTKTINHIIDKFDLTISFDKSIELEQTFDHSVGGNEDRHSGYKSIKLEEKCKKGISNKELEQIELIASRLNNKYG